MLLLTFGRKADQLQVKAYDSRVLSVRERGNGNLRKCRMRKVICGTKSAEVGCGTVGNLRNAE